MNILLICQCDKRALVETRRILDQFAERRGERTWQTPITQAGLDTLRRLLKKTARRNTAVACHWIRGLDHSELLWIVGDASRFNEQGAVPTNITQRNILRKEDENDWHTAQDIRLLAQLASLLHDLGKASVAFQARLRQPSMQKNLYRHEWVSLRLFQAFVGHDDDETWLNRLIAPTADDDATWLAKDRYQRDGLDANTAPPFRQLPPLAAAIAWLVVSHHRLPVLPAWDDQGIQQLRLGQKSKTFNPSQLDNLLDGITHEWNESSRTADPGEIATYWQFEHALPVTFPKWRAQAAKVASQLLVLRNKAGKGDWLSNPYVMHLARMSLMLADHHYSALKRDSRQRVHGDNLGKLYANTDSDGSLKQPLDEHLLGVARLSTGIVHGLPGFERHLPRLARHRGLKKRSNSERFRWQDKAADAATSLRNHASTNGGFIINMASTGCGKTLANARIMYALADPHFGMRCTFALGLRTLTLQTANSYRQDLHLGEDELAVQVGGAASRTLFEYFQAEAELTGSASIQQLIDEDSHVLYEGQLADHGLLSKAMDNPRIASLLAAPMLVCTIDHLMPATEAQRAGRQIAPMLRMMSSDLVLDELDDFDLADLPALTRLIHWAGLLGTRVLLSSATLPPSLLDGMFQAYRAGRRHYQRNRGVDGEQGASRIEIPCLWVDEFNTHSTTCSDAQCFLDNHTQFVQRRIKALEKVEPRRCAELLPLKIETNTKEVIRQIFARHIQEAMQLAHNRHAENCPRSGKRVSFGLVRMANIEPLFDVALELLKLGAGEDYRVHLCVYHSRFPLLLRSAIEQQLDNALNRRDPQAVYDLPEIRQAIDGFPESNHLFVVLGSPVTEVGRDHDYDWAIVEPSSMRSLIQLAGRIQRHRNQPCRAPNIFIFDTNLRHFEKTNGKDGQPAAAFIKPGFEQDNSPVEHPFRLATHRLGKLLQESEYQTLTAIPRIQSRPPHTWQPKQSLVDLEHARLAEQMLPKDRSLAQQPIRRGVKPQVFELDAACAWQYPQAALTWVLPQQQPFRENTARETELVFLPDEDQEHLVINRIHEKPDYGKPALYVPVQGSQIDLIDLSLQPGPRITPWGQHELMDLLTRQAEAQGLSLQICAERFTPVSVPESTYGWRYHPMLGFAKKRSS
ncbi:CRISPR-associated endonuclease/helicase Cas3 [Pseudomonas sp. NFPP07]|uniref:type I-F CRISPR-associated helicase Cas3f n=1 Tax=Pseudomonas sp. NFPP07 TaxID=1566213 RepID=UPI0008F0B1B2|nr:type I-F CRISPR-associated helicase Cas3f [Pseudomonas sp. NFPP07]SFP30168.1 CRISPR-associated endonuclease/helicase Cas3 [Pseudomonas sp. NFPP07]